VCIKLNCIAYNLSSLSDTLGDIMECFVQESMTFYLQPKMVYFGSQGSNFKALVMTSKSSTPIPSGYRVRPFQTS